MQYDDEHRRIQERVASFALKVKIFNNKESTITAAQHTWPEKVRLPSDVYESLYIHWVLKFMGSNTIFSVSALREYFDLVHAVKHSEFEWLVTDAGFDRHFVELIEHAFYVETISISVLNRVCGNMENDGHIFNHITPTTALKYSRFFRKFLLFLVNIDDMNSNILRNIQAEVQTTCRIFCQQESIRNEQEQQQIERRTFAHEVCDKFVRGTLWLPKIRSTSAAMHQKREVLIRDFLRSTCVHLTRPTG